MVVEGVVVEVVEEVVVEEVEEVEEVVVEEVVVEEVEEVEEVVEEVEASVVAVWFFATKQNGLRRLYLRIHQ